MASFSKSGNGTLLTHHGRDPAAQHGFVNTPVTRGSTVVFPTLDAVEHGNQKYRYGRTGNPSMESVELLISKLEGAVGTVLTPSGLSAISTALLSVVSSGDDILITDSTYEPTRKFCDGVLTRMGVSVRYYDPRIGADIESLLQKNTKLIFMESPGSISFEIQDVPAITEIAKRHNIVTVIDNSWATPLFLKPMSLGVDIVVHAGTKMFVGHSDAMFGTASANDATWQALKTTHNNMGICASPDDCFLAARGLRTLELRMNAHQQSALELAEWLQEQPLVETVLHPALPTHPDHDLFKRDFSGSGCLFSFILSPAPREAIAAMLDNMDLFSMGYSWGGFESLILPYNINRMRTAKPWAIEGNLIRVHVGLESIADLKADIEAGLTRYAAARG